MTKQTTDANVEQMMIYYDSLFLEGFRESLRLDNWADHKNIPLGTIVSPSVIFIEATFLMRVGWA